MPTNRHRKLTFIFLSGALLAMPITEVAKLICLLLFQVSVFCSSSIAKIKSEADILDYLLAGWMLSGFFSAFFSPFEHKAWQGVPGNILIPLTLMCTRHARFSTRRIRLLLIFILLSTVIAASVGFARIAAHTQDSLKLPSVGHVNHSAIYLCLNFAVALSFYLGSIGKSPLKLAASAACLIFITVSIIYSASRGSTITMLIISIVTTVYWTQKSAKPLIITLIFLSLMTASLIYWKAPVVEKTQNQATAGDFIPERKKIWNSALLIWRHNPVFGVGIKNFIMADKAIQRQWLAEDGRRYSAAAYQAAPHAHNFYLNLLAEQGLFGFGIIISSLWLIALSLIRNIPKPEFPDIFWILWFSAAGGLQVVLINGLVNTTLHHEHGLLFAVISGLWLGYVKGRQKTKRQPPAIKDSQI